MFFNKLKKSVEIALLGSILLISPISTLADVKVKGYYRKDGTYVRPHMRSNKDGNFYNNWSTIGNVNPYTGVYGTKTTPNYNYSNTSYQYTSSVPYTQSKPYYQTNYNTISTVNDLSSYRLPNSSDLKGDWEEYLVNQKMKLWQIEGDFNNDGKKDQAVIMPKIYGKGFAVVAFLNLGLNQYEIMKLEEYDDLEHYYFSLEYAEPSLEKIPTACGKGYWECEIGEPESIIIKYDSIWFCKVGSSCSLFVWNSRNNRFNRIDISG